MRGIRESENKLKEIQNCRLENKIDVKVKKNVEYSLAMKLRDLAKETKALEKKYLDKMKKLNEGTLDDLEINGD